MPPSSLDCNLIDWDAAMEWSYSRHPKFTRLFLQKSLHNRLNRLGLTQWKQHVLRRMDFMVEWQDIVMAHEADARELREHQAKEICIEVSKYEMMEVTSLVELALWKMKCLSGFETNSGNRTFDSMEDIFAFEQEDDSFVAADYIKECRITCNADSIIPNIIPFLK